MPGVWIAPLSRDPGCHWCAHPAHYLPCDRECDCDQGRVLLGIDTALGD